MRTHSAAMAASIAVAMIAATASAQSMYDGGSLYIGLGAGVSQPADQTIGSSVGIDTDLVFDWDWTASGTVGFRFGNGLRSEFEFNYRTNDIDSFEGAALAGGKAPAQGDVQAYSGIVNLLYDFDLGSIVTPYIGAGVGAGYFDYNDLNTSPAAGPNFNDSTWSLVYQGIAGVSVAVADDIELFADYRYFSTAWLDVEDTGLGITLDNDDEYRSHTVMAGLRYTLWSPKAPAPMPVAAPAPAPEPAMVPRNFLVFFEWDRSDLTPEAKGIIADAAAYAAQGGISRIHLTGHTDTSGAADYNVGLSQRRAESVKTELVTMHSMSPDAISTAWRGESDPLVATGDGVREPQNRRVEIVFP